MSGEAGVLGLRIEPDIELGAEELEGDGLSSEAQECMVMDWLARAAPSVSG